MANKYWIGSALDGDFSNTNNWSATEFGATGAGAPSSNDVVYILRGPSITTGLNQAAVDLNALTIAFDGNIGTASTSLTIAVSGVANAPLIYRGTGSIVNITAGTNGIDVLHVESSRDSGFNLTGGTTVDIRAGRRGKLIIAGGAVVSGSIKSAGMDFDIADNATDIPTAVFDGGTVLTRRDIDIVTVGPECRYRTHEDVTVDTSIDVYGTFEHFSSGTIASLVAHPGSVSTSRGGTAAGFTLTASVKYEGAQMFEGDPGITYTAEPVVIGRATR